MKNTIIIIAVIGTLTTCWLDVFVSLKGIDRVFHPTSPNIDSLKHSIKRIELTENRHFEECSLDSIRYLLDRPIVDN